TIVAGRGGGGCPHLRFRAGRRGLQAAVRDPGEPRAELGALSGRPSHAAARAGREHLMKRVLVISPHPDDESIGCGGTLRQHVVDGDAAHAVFLTSGERGRRGRPLPETARLREQEARDAAAILGLSGIEFWLAPDGAVAAAMPSLAARLTDKIAA